MPGILNPCVFVGSNPTELTKYGGVPKRLKGSVLKTDRSVRCAGSNPAASAKKIKDFGRETVVR